MAKYLFVNGLSAGWLETGSHYYPILGDLDFDTIEAQTQWKSRTDCSFSDLYIIVTANATTAASTVVSRLNGANGNITLSIPAGTTGAFTDAVNSDALVTDDLYCTYITRGSANDLFISTISYLMESASPRGSLMSTYVPTGVAIGTTRYHALEGVITPNATEASAQYKFQKAVTLANARIYVNANTCTNTSTFVIRINGADGNEIVSIGSGLTGWFEDNINTDNILINDLVNYQCNPSGVGTLTYAILNVDCLSTSFILMTSNTTGDGVDGTRYWVLSGNVNSTNTTESKVQILARADFVGRNLHVLVRLNLSANATTFNTRKNGGAGNLTVSIPAGTTGLYEDLINEDVLIATDIYNFQQTQGVTGEIGYFIIGVQLDNAGGPPPGGGAFSAVSSKLVGECMV